MTKQFLIWLLVGSMCIMLGQPAVGFGIISIAPIIWILRKIGLWNERWE